VDEGVEHRGHSATACRGGVDAHVRTQISGALIFVESFSQQSWPGQGRPREQPAAAEEAVSMMDLQGRGLREIAHHRRRRM